MSAQERRIELPQPASRFVGRRAELARLESLFAGGARLVTLWGSGGIGKTRLALQFAAAYARRLKATAKAYLCDVADAQDLLGICAVIGRSLDVPLPPGENGADDLSDKVGLLLRGRGPSLFLLDNFERVAELAPMTVTRWLAIAPDARFLVTSRERLRVDAEVVEEIGPLSLVAGDGDRSEAVELFLDRAAALGFVADADSVKTAAELVAELEGIPLAIELAAGRVDTLGIEGMLEPMRRLRITPLEDLPSSIRPRLEVLAGGRRDMSKRQMTIRDAIYWSWELLTPVERRALAQCAVFRAGFTPAAAGRVLDLGEDAPPALDVIQSLRNKSLIRSYQASRGEVRMALFESVREFADDQLERLGETAAVVARHREFFLDVAPRLATRGAEGLRLLSAELDNLMSIAERALGRTSPGAADATVALQALTAIEPVFAARGPITLYLAWLDRAIAAADTCGGVPPGVRAKALQARGRAQPQRGRTQEGLVDLTSALEAARAAGDRSTEGYILSDIGKLHHHAREMDEARSFYEKALALQRGLGDRRAIGMVMINLGALHHDLKNLEEADTHYTRALVIFREVGDRRYEAVIMSNLGVLHLERGDGTEAQRAFEQALVLMEEVGNRRMEAIVLGNLGVLHHEHGRFEAARMAHQKALASIREVGDRRPEGLCLTRLGAVLAEEGRVEEAAERFLAAEDILAMSADAITLEFVAVARAFLDVAHALGARSAQRDTEAAAHIRQARARIARARAGGADRPAPAEISDDIRVAIRILERSLDRLDTGASEALAPPLDVLLIGPEAQWVRPPNGDWLDLRRRRPLRLLMLRLVEQREGSSGTALSLDALREAGWPGESMTHEAAVNRIHVALAELRKRGLKSVLVKSDHGYLLDAGVEVRRVPGAMCPT